MRNRFMNYISWYMIIAMFMICIAPRVDAGLAPSEIIALAQPDRVADIEKIQKVIEVKAISERLKQFGLTQDEVQTRLAQMSDQQIHQVALQMDSLRVGQSDAGVVIIIILVIAILVVVLLKVTGHKVIITK
jgi:hypothetical protein